jgi:hypothetical protein
LEFYYQLLQHTGIYITLLGYMFKKIQCQYPLISCINYMEYVSIIIVATHEFCASMNINVNLKEP